MSRNEDLTRGLQEDLVPNESDILDFLAVQPLGQRVSRDPSHPSRSAVSVDSLLWGLSEMRQRYLSMLVVSLALVMNVACGSGSLSDDRTGSTTSHPGGCEPPALTDATEPAPFHLYVSNQSFDIDPVRIEVFIDDLAVVCQDFEVGDQHNWVLFDMELDSGPHMIRVVGNDGGAELTETFDTASETWAVIDFWYHSGEENEGQESRGQSLTFDISDEPIGFD